MKTLLAMIVLVPLLAQCTWRIPDDVVGDEPLTDRIAKVDFGRFKGIEMEYDPGRFSRISGIMEPDSVRFAVGVDSKWRIINDVKFYKTEYMEKDWPEELYIRSFPLDNEELAMAFDLVALVQGGFQRLKVDCCGAASGEIWDNKSGMFVRFEIPDTQERREQLQSKGYRDVGHNIMIHEDE